jgi:hypothetical protein
MPVLNRIKRKFKGKVNFIAITFNDDAAVKQFLKSHRFDYIQVADAQSLTKTLGLEQYPKNVILDKDGIIRDIKGPLTNIINGKQVAGNGKDFEASINAVLSGRTVKYIRMESIE